MGVVFIVLKDSERTVVVCNVILGEQLRCLRVIFMH